jgi:hypothetical protein
VVVHVVEAPPFHPLTSFLGAQPINQSVNQQKIPRNPKLGKLSPHPNANLMLFLFTDLKEYNIREIAEIENFPLGCIFPMQTVPDNTPSSSLLFP